MYNSAEEILSKYIGGDETMDLNQRVKLRANEGDIIMAMRAYATDLGERVRDVAALKIYTEESEITLAKMKIIRDIKIEDMLR